MFCYFNDGMSFKSVLADYQPEAGEVIFPNYATSDQLTQSFPNYAKLSGNSSIKKQIHALEDQQTDRRIRDAIAGADNGWLASLNTQISTLRSQLQS